MNVMINIDEEELEAMTWMETVKDFISDHSEQPNFINAVDTIDNLIERIYWVAENRMRIDLDEKGKVSEITETQIEKHVELMMRLREMDRKRLDAMGIGHLDIFRQSCTDTK